jgi:hypothetical protein
MGFHKATKKSATGKVAIMGPAGAGKTFTGLQILTLLGVKKLAGIDTERGSMSKYSGDFAFDVNDGMEDFSIRKYLGAIGEAKAAGYDGLLIDSLTHAWSGKGGALEQVNRMGGNKFTNGWGTVTPLQNQLVDSILTFPGHVVATMRSKIEYVMETGADGKAIPKRAGTKPIQRDDVEYEFDLVLDIQQGGNISILKTRCKKLPAGYWGGYSDVPRLVAEFKAWLTEDAEVDRAVQVIEKAIGFEPEKAAQPAPVTKFDKFAPPVKK